MLKFTFRHQDHLQRLFGTLVGQGAVVRCPIALIFLAAFFSASRGEALTYTNYTTYISLSNIVASIPVDNFDGGGNGGFELKVNAVFHIPLLDSANYTITSATFGLGGTIGMAIWGDPNFLFADIACNVGVGSTNAPAGWFSEQQVCSDGFSPYFSCVTDYSDSANPFVPPYPVSYYLTGSPIDQGGYTIFAGVFSVVSGDISGADGGLLAFVANIHLKVVYQVETNSPTASGLPPITPLIPQLSLAGLGLPVPTYVNLPDYVLRPAGLNVAGIQAQGNDINISWYTVGGKTNFVQRCTAMSSSNFTDISGPIVVPGVTVSQTNFVDVGGATNSLSRYYRVRIVSP